MRLVGSATIYVLGGNANAAMSGVSIEPATTLPSEFQQNVTISGFQPTLGACAGNERIALLSPNAHVPSQETQERMMYGTSMLGMFAEYAECRALIGRQPGLAQVLASLIQVIISEG